MGRIRPSFVKIRAIKLVNEYPGEFTPDFENNKNLVEKYKVDVNVKDNWGSTPLRNAQLFNSIDISLKRYHGSTKCSKTSRNKITSKFLLIWSFTFSISSHIK